jgi:hypothetical protein
MRTSLIRSSWAAVGFAAVASLASAAVLGAGKVPVISARSYTSGNAKVTVTGSFQIRQDIAINNKASYSDGEMTWLQFGASGAESPNALITVSPDEVGVNVGLGKQTATAGGDACTGKMDVTSSSVAGHYKCIGVVSYDPRDFKMGKVDIEIVFTAR